MKGKWFHFYFVDNSVKEKRPHFTKRSQKNIMKLDEMGSVHR